MMKEFDLAVKQRKELQEWWKLGSTVACYSKGNHQLRVDIKKPDMISFCGQAYVGSDNYHNAPGFFFEALKKEIDSNVLRLTTRAYEDEIDRLNNIIKGYREAIIEEINRA
jgi:hypothetical protein